MALALGLVAWLLSRISVGEISRLLRDLSAPWATAALAGYLMAHLLRAERYRVLIRAVGQSTSEATNGDRGPAGPAGTERLAAHQRATSSALPAVNGVLLPISLIQSMFNSLLGRAGEVSFLYLAKAHMGLSLGRSTAVIVVARVLDYLAISAILVGAVFALPGGTLATDPQVFLILSTGLVLVAGVLVLAPWLGARTLATASRWLDGYQLAQRVLGSGLTLVRALTLIRAGRVLALSFLWSILVWLVSFGWIYAFLTALGIRVSPPSFIVGATFGVIAKALPLVTPGGFGTHEAGWTMGFVLVGHEPATAIASGFAINILTLAASIIYGLPTLLWMQLRRNHS